MLCTAQCFQTPLRCYSYLICTAQCFCPASCCALPSALPHCPVLLIVSASRCALPNAFRGFDCYPEAVACHLACPRLSQCGVCEAHASCCFSQHWYRPLSMPALLARLSYLVAFPCLAAHRHDVFVGFAGSSQREVVWVGTLSRLLWLEPKWRRHTANIKPHPHPANIHRMQCRYATLLLLHIAYAQLITFTDHHPIMSHAFIIDGNDMTTIMMRRYNDAEITEMMEQQR